MPCLLPAADMKCFLLVLSCLAVLGKCCCSSVRSMGKFNPRSVPVIPRGSFPSALGFEGQASGGGQCVREDLGTHF